MQRGVQSALAFVNTMYVYMSPSVSVTLRNAIIVALHRNFTMDPATCMQPSIDAMGGEYSIYGPSSAGAHYGRFRVSQSLWMTVLGV